jgi:hypothetical protein
VRSGAPGLRAVDFGDLGGVEPVGRAFGGDRGTPLDRRYIDRFLARHAGDIRGIVLEVGETLYTTRFGGSAVEAAETVDGPETGNPQATYLVDLQTGQGLPQRRFDCVILTQTLHMTYDTRGVLRTVREALAPGGVVLATVPGITPIDQADGPEKWFWAMTQSAARRLFSELFGPDHVEVEQFGNVYAATAFLQGLAAEELDAGKLAVVDPLFPVITGIRAVRR